MADVLGTATLPAGTGNKSINVGQLLRKVELIVCGKNGGDVIGHLSIGKMLANGTAKVASMAADGSNAKSDPPQNQVIRHYEKIGGVWTLVFEAIPQATPFSGTHININVTTATASDLYTILIDGET